MNRITSPTSPAPFRILVIDDTPAIHDDFKKILTPDPRLTGAVEPAEHDLFGSPPPQPAVKHKLNFALSCATQGEAGVQLAAEARQANRPFAVAFVDMRMPPGWDGIQTAKKLWETDPAIQVVICTAFADHSAGDIVRQLGNSDSLLILKKPFDTVEAWQMAASLAEKWQLSRTLKSHLDSLQTSIEERTEELEKSLALVQATLEGRQRAETALRDSANYYRLLFEKSPTPIYVHDQETFAFLAVNEAAVAHYGYSLHEFLDLTLKEIALVEEIPAFNQKISSLTHDSCNAGIWRHRKKNGKLCSMEITTHALEFAGRKAWLTLAMDVTERLNLEAQLRQSQKMESVGQLAGGIAHDFNNLLTVINGHAGLLLAREQLTPRIAEPLKEIFEAAKRAADLTRQLMAFSRKQILQTQVVDLNEVVNNVSKMLRRVLGEDIALEVSFAGHVSIKADLGMMEQVLLNLAVNSRDAMPRGGRLNINIHPALIDAAQVKANPEANAGLHVCLSFTDTGCGIAPEILPRIFEPFFTTKELDRGTGLGLATVYGIIKQHQGWIEVISELGKGTTFKIFCRPVCKRVVTPKCPRWSNG